MPVATVRAAASGSAGDLSAASSVSTVVVQQFGGYPEAFCRVGRDSMRYDGGASATCSGPCGGRC
ncbi:hypothetical protein GCM10009712_17690 [Pseudarthrobacter sulfonivorans]|uniref:hypothetical protein n=1 Tax=Pseudarthrobacter sulfonivorans TaxID=121292 RepID=UPI00168BCB59|nr:hypothetical protein [Pseudarthrobacter sulfonivorans]